MFQELHILKKVLPTLHQNEDVLLGPGDDCAAVRCGNEVLLLAADQVIGDVHFYRHATTPQEAGAKLLKRNLSDIAAMGGVARFALLTLAVGDDRDAAYLEGFIEGVEQASRQFGVVLIGGDLAALAKDCHGDVASLSIVGLAPGGDFVRRDTAREGDILCVTGALGNTLASGHHLTFRPRLDEGAFLRAFGVTAMLDLSDGIALDAARLAEASGLSVELDVSQLPLREGASPKQALVDGEDYELCFTVSPERYGELCRIWPKTFASLHRVGAMRSRGKQVMTLRHAGTMDLADVKGYEHGKNK